MKPLGYTLLLLTTKKARRKRHERRGPKKEGTGVF